MSEITHLDLDRHRPAGRCDARDRPQHSVGGGRIERDLRHIGGVTTAAAATGKAASEVLANARELDTQSGMLRSAVDEFLVKVRAA